MWLSQYVQDTQIKHGLINPIKALEKLFFEGDETILFSDSGVYRIEPNGRQIPIETYYSIPLDLEEALMLASIGPLYGVGEPIDDDTLNSLEFDGDEYLSKEWVYKKIGDLYVLDTHLVVHFNTIKFIKNIKNSYLLDVLYVLCEGYILHLNEYIDGKPIKNICPSCSEKHIRKEYVKTVQKLNKIMDYIQTTRDK